MLTRRKTSPKEHVEEVLGGDVGLEAAVEVGVAVSVARGVEFLVPELVVLLPLLGVAQHRVRIPDGCQDKEEAVSSCLPPTALQAASICLSPCTNQGPRLPTSLQQVPGHTSWANPDRRKAHLVKNSLINSNEGVMI